MLRTEKDLYMKYEEYESFNYTEDEIMRVICSDCDYIESTDEKLGYCSECGGSVKYEEYESFNYTESEIMHVICSDCDYIESTDEKLDYCSECGGSVTYDLDIEDCECAGCRRIRDGR